MKPRHLSLMHGGRCTCARCRFEVQAALVLLGTLGVLALAALGFWLDAQFVRWVVGR